MSNIKNYNVQSKLGQSMNYNASALHKNIVINETLTIPEMYSGCTRKINYLRYKKNRMENVEREINFPAGIYDGDKLTFFGEGDEYESIYGHTERSNLIVEVSGREDSRFKREKNNLYTNLAISQEEANEGFQKDVYLPDGSYFTIYSDGKVKPGSFHYESGLGFNGGPLIVRFNIIPEENQSDYSSDFMSVTPSSIASADGNISFYSSSSDCASLSAASLSDRASSSKLMSSTYSLRHSSMPALTEVGSTGSLSPRLFGPEYQPLLGSFESYVSKNSLSEANSDISLETEPDFADFEIHEDMDPANLAGSLRESRVDCPRNIESPSSGLGWLFSFLW